MRVRILRSRDFTPADNRRITVAYKAGYELTIKREWGEALVAEGDAEELEAPARDPLDHDDGNGRRGGSLPKKARAKA